MDFELDQYFTPPQVASRLVGSCVLPEVPAHCLDPACGRGDLLSAASAGFRDTAIAGIDMDAKAIARLRRMQPSWKLSVADFMHGKSYARTKVAANSTPADFVLLNPPFSQRPSKYVEVGFAGQGLRAGFAMGFLLRSMDLFQPRLGGAAILPESALYSEIDSEGRRLLASKYEVRHLFELGSSTFRGARARTVAVQLIPSAEVSLAAHSAMANVASVTVELRRGVLPMHHVRCSRIGLPLIHSTDLAEWSAKARRKIQNDARRTVSGWVVLMPRVGSVTKKHVIGVRLKERSELSDCVIGLICRDRSACDLVLSVIDINWLEFQSLYRGTGARYVTVERLKDLAWGLWSRLC